MYIRINIFIHFFLLFLESHLCILLTFVWYCRLWRWKFTKADVYTCPAIAANPYARTACGCITESVCCLVWKRIVHKCSSSSSLTKQYLGSGCKVPVCTNNGDIRVSSATQAYIPDDLQLKELFKGRSPMVNFSWHPNPSDPQIPLDSLFSIYNHLGVRNISQALTKTEISMQQRISWQKLKFGEGILGMALCRVCECRIFSIIRT